MIPFSVRGLKFGSFGFAKGRLVCLAKSNVPNAGWLKLFLKNVRWEKKKKHWVGLSVGLPVVELKYGLYGVQLSMFVCVLKFSFWSVVCLVLCRPIGLLTTYLYPLKTLSYPSYPAVYLQLIKRL